MYEIRNRELPSSLYSSDRELALGYTHHGDVVLSVSEDGNNQSYIFAHGSEETLAAASLGYLVRSGLESTDIKEVVTSSCAELLEEYDTTELVNMRPINSSSLKLIASGSPCNRFNNPVMGWDALCVPISRHPGTIDRVGGTGIYTRTDILGNLSLLFAELPSKASSSFETNEQSQKSELYADDIPVFIKLLSESAMGEYSKDVARLFNNVLSE